MDTLPSSGHDFRDAIHAIAAEYYGPNDAVDRGCYLLSDGIRAKSDLLKYMVPAAVARISRFREKYLGEGNRGEQE
jgi:hypothetical protein